MGFTSPCFPYWNFYIIIYGDSKVIIESMNDKYNLHVLLINHWCQRVRSLKRFFKHITFKHVSRTFNTRVDILSNSVISLKFGLLPFQEFLEGILIHEGEFDLLDMV